MKIYSILGNSQKLDGGSMFGNAPKAVWKNWVDVDEQNRIDLTCRALLIENAGQTILFETGIGAFFDPKLKDRYGVVESEHVLLNNLNALGYSDADIDLVVLSHLHFDHAGGLLSAYEEGKASELLFPNAKFVCSQRAWERANNPHFRDRASFLPHLNQLLESSGRLELVTGRVSDILGDAFSFHYSDGHTPGMLLTEFDYRGKPMVFAADLIPGEPWVHLPITMGYDRYPECLIDEKQRLLKDLHHRGGGLYLTHDPQTACGWVSQDDKGRYRLSDKQSSIALG
jgi:glyoxylase-like metal-dependent hydrolase (beta-lactamase superfamily II)